MPIMKTLTLGNTQYTIVGSGSDSLPAGYAYADSIPENADHSIKYILPDGYIWEWRDQETTVVVPYNANTGIINQVPAVSQTDETLYTENGVLLSERILWDDSWTEYEKQPTAITISGISQLVKAYNSPIIVYYYKKDGSYLTAMQATQMHSIGAASNDNPIALPITFNLADNNVYPINNIGHVRVLLGISASGAITANDVVNVVINVPFYDTEQSVSGGSWVNTGTKYTPSEDGDDSELESRVDDLETSVSALQDDVEIKDEGKILYAVGDSITYGYGVGGNNFSWVKHVIDRNGYDATNSRNLGESGLGFCTTSTSNHTIQDIVGGTDFSGADIVTVALGLNDWKNSSVTLSDFWTGMEYVFNKIRTDNPYCKLFFILPFNARFLGTFASFYCLGSKGEGNASLCYGNTLQTFLNLIKAKLQEATFQAFHIQTIDMMECPAINRHNIETALIDYTHPSAQTQAALGKEIARRIMLADGAR